MKEKKEEKEKQWQTLGHRKMVETVNRFVLSVCMLSCFSHVQLFVAPWTAPHQPPLFMGSPGRDSEWVTISFYWGSFWPVCSVTKGLNLHLPPRVKSSRIWKQKPDFSRKYPICPKSLCVQISYHSSLTEFCCCSHCRSHVSVIEKLYWKNYTLYWHEEKN